MYTFELNKLEECLNYNSETLKELRSRVAWLEDQGVFDSYVNLEMIDKDRKGNLIVRPDCPDFTMFAYERLCNDGEIAFYVEDLMKEDFLDFYMEKKKEFDLAQVEEKRFRKEAKERKIYEELKVKFDNASPS